MLAISASALLIWLAAQAGVTAEGIDLFRQGNYSEARASLESALRANPQDNAARAFLAMTKAAMRECGPAALEFAANGNASLARMSGLAALECNPGDFALLSQLAARFPDDADVLYEAAKIHRKAWDQAVYGLYQKAPASYRVNQLSAEVFETQGKYGEAVAQYRKAIEKAPDALNLHYRLGRCLLLDAPTPERLQEARAEFAAELKLNPADAVAIFQVGQILAAEQKPAEALVKYEEAIRQRPEFAEALVAAGKARSQTKDYESAAKLLERAVQLQPANEGARYNLMIAYRNLGRTSDAMNQKKELERLQKPPEGEFTEFLKKLGEKPVNP